MGPRSSAIVGGTTAMHRELEQGLADLKGTEECLLFPTGRQSAGLHSVITLKSHQQCAKTCTLLMCFGLHSLHKCHTSSV